MLTEKQKADGVTLFHAILIIICIFYY